MSRVAQVIAAPKSTRLQIDWRRPGPMLKYVTRRPSSTWMGPGPAAIAAVYPPFSNDQTSISSVPISGLSGVGYQRTWLTLVSAVKHAAGDGDVGADRDPVAELALQSTCSGPASAPPGSTGSSEKCPVPRPRAALPVGRVRPELERQLEQLAVEEQRLDAKVEVAEAGLCWHVARVELPVGNTR